jgi:preprotein translocase subunit SecE
MKKITKYLNEVVSEIKKVTWPTKKQTTDKTILVIAVSLAVALYIGGLDYIFQQMMAFLINN